MGFESFLFWSLIESIDFRDVGERSKTGLNISQVFGFLADGDVMGYCKG